MPYEKTQVPLSNGFYTLDQLPISAQECRNCVPVIIDKPSLVPQMLIGTPGLTQVATTGSLAADANRGAWDLNGIPYFVQGTTLYRLNFAIVSGEEVWTPVSKGTIAGSGRVSMADNGVQLMILVPGGNGYIYTEAGGLLQITDADFTANGNPQYVVFIDGYFACSTDGKKWIVSNLNDGLTWDSSDSGTAESDPDAVVAPVVYQNQIYLTGSETTETAQNIGGAGFPFQRGNQFFDKGCFAPASLINKDQRFFMIGGGKDEFPAIWMFQSGKYTKISTLAIDQVLAEYTQNAISAAFSLAWGQRGQYYVSFTFPDRTFTYNISSTLWHEQKSGIPDIDTGDLVDGPWRVTSLVTAYGFTLVGDSQDGRIGKLDQNVYQEYGNNIIRVFSMQPLSSMGSSFRLPLVELTMEPGVGDNTVEDPVVSMAISEDGFIFQYERTRRIGKVGRYGQRAIWRKNGRVPRYATLRFRFSDPVKFVVAKLEIGVS